MKSTLGIVKLATYGLCAYVVLGSHSIARQPDNNTAYGTPDTALEAYSEYAFMRGEWKASMVALDTDGKRKHVKNSAHITGFYHSDGRTFQTCFSASNFHSTDIRAYNQTAGVWQAHFLNATAQRWSGLESKKVGATMETIVPGGYAGTADFDVKSVQHNIQTNSFINNIYRRTKGTEAWMQTYEMTYTKQPNDPNGPHC